MISTASASIARHTVTNSSTSRRRSPFSYLATKLWGFLSRPATSAWVSPAAFRAPLRRARKRSWAAVWIGLHMRPGSGEALRKLIR